MKLVSYSSTNDDMLIVPLQLCTNRPLGKKLRMTVFQMRT